MSFKKVTNCTAALPLDVYPTHWLLYTESTEFTIFVKNKPFGYYDVYSQINYYSFNFIWKGDTLCCRI